jgi:hypothetical protein
MCFGKTWSVISFSLLTLTTVAGLYFRIPSRITLATGFLAIKELIQVLLYHHLDNGCTDVNKYLTAAAWIHISFQPLFMNLFISAFSATPKLYDVPLMLCFIYAVVNMFRLREIGGQNTKQCIPDDSTLCRPVTCSKAGKHHVAYGFALNSADVSIHTPSLFAYFLLSFAPAFIIGDWLFGVINASVAIMSFTLNTHDAGEAAAIWCVNAMWIAFFAIYYILKNRLTAS